ncbi:MAG: hypothetical protein KC910_13630 [Candidatus Eremiobacteraeota bacterium]|nr:hypothetical protein [Candidatus Eremiobacteraeota bacterium]
MEDTTRLMRHLRAHDCGHTRESVALLESLSRGRFGITLAQLEEQLWQETSREERTFLACMAISALALVCALVGVAVGPELMPAAVGALTVAVYTAWASLHHRRQAGSSRRRAQLLSTDRIVMALAV